MPQCCWNPEHHQRGVCSISRSRFLLLFFSSILRSSKRAVNKAIAESSTLNPTLFGKQDLAVLQHNSKLGRHLHRQGGGRYQQALPFPLCDQGKGKGKHQRKNDERHFHVTPAGYRALEWLRMWQRVWHNLDGTYILAVVHDGLLFDRTAGMDPVTPDPSFSPRPRYTCQDLHQNLALCSEKKKAIGLGALKCVKLEKV